MGARGHAVALALFPVVVAGCFDFSAASQGGGDKDAAPDANDARVPDGSDASKPSDAASPSDATSGRESGPAPGEDGGPGGMDGATDSGGGEDGGMDASAIDTGAVDAGMDSTMPTSFCSTIVPPAGAVSFCDDFDQLPLPGSWATYRQTSGTFVDSQTTARSSPTSVDEQIPPLMLYDPVDVSLRTFLGVPTLPATARFAFSVYPVQTDPANGAAIVLGALDFLDAGGDRYTLELAINVLSGTATLALGEQSGLADGASSYINHPLSAAQPLPVNAWTDLEIDVDWTASTTAQASVLVNGVTELAAVPLTMTVSATSLQIGIGTTYVSEPSATWEIRYDNVWFVAAQ